MVELTMLSALARIAFNLLQTNKQDNTVGAIANLNARSLLELGQVTEVEAITVVDTALTMHESTTDVLKFANTLYGSWYLSAASVLTDTGRIKTVELLSKLNPSKSPSYAVTNTILSAAEKGLGKAISVGLLNHEVALESVVITPENAPLMLPRTVTQMTASMEAALPAPPEPTDTDTSKTNKTMDTAPSVYVGGMRNANDLATVANLSIGQAVTLNISDGKASKDVVVNIRLVSTPTPARILATILKWSDKDMRLKSRISAWRAGELRFWRDVVLMRDVFIERQRLLMDDRSDLFKTLLGRQRNSMINSVLSATPDIGNMSSILVISQDNLRRIEELELEGQLSNYNFRQRVMANTGLVLIIVVDPLSEFVTIYNHTSALPTECSIRQMKSAGKGGATDFAELIKLMNQNKMPSF